MPVQPSPAVTRAADLLKTMADDPEREWSLTDLARALDMHPSSCQTVTLALVEAGLLQRRGVRGTYRLGPALVPLGERARKALGVVELAQPELMTLRERYDTTAILGMVSDSAIIAVSVLPAPQPLGYGIVPDMAVPFKAPIGSVYVAWESETEIDGWINRSSSTLTRSRQRGLRADLGLIRERGWSATIRSDGQRGPSSYREVNDRDLRHDLLLVGISAPVFDGNGSVACSLALITFTERVSGSRVLEMARALTQAAIGLSQGAPRR
jgi:DNA-binding IclR family transcriptional regulator